MSETVRQIVEAIRENRRRFEAFCYSLSEEELMRPVPDSTWVVRDFAAHLGTLDAELARWFAALGRDAAPTELLDEHGAAFDVDAFNDAQVLERRSWPLDRVFAEAEQNRRLLVETLSALTDEQIAQQMHFAGDAKRRPADLPLKTFLVGWAQHDPIHVADMLKALPERAGDADLKAWLDNPFVAGYQAIMNR